MKLKRMEKIYNEFNYVTEEIDTKYPSFYVFYMDNGNIYSLRSLNYIDTYIYQLKNNLIDESKYDLNYDWVIEKWKSHWTFDDEDYREENQIFWDFESENDINEMIEVLEYIMSLNIKE